MASDGISIEVKGLKEAQRALYSYSQKLGDFVVYKALREGANVMRRDIAILAPAKTGTLRKGFKVARSKIHNGRRSSALIGVYVTLKKGKGRKDPKDPFYGRWQELGWNTAGQRSGTRQSITSAFGGRSGRKTLRGKTNVPGKFFVQKAFDRSKEKSANLIVQLSLQGAEALSRREGLT